MDTNMHDKGIAVLSGGAQLLDRVAPLWMELRRHHAEVAPRWAGSLLAGSFEERRADLAKKGARGLLVLMAVSGSEDIGYCVSTIAADGKGEVDSLYVAPSHRRRGVGNALMGRTMEWFATQSVKSIAVEVLSGNDAAAQFYARYGFAPRTIRLLHQSDESSTQPLP
jgi:ribosomal protein S18 acetylase RimI-like enzyme